MAARSSSSGLERSLPASREASSAFERISRTSLRVSSLLDRDGCLDQHGGAVYVLLDRVVQPVQYAPLLRLQRQGLLSPRHDVARVSDGVITHRE